MKVLFFLSATFAVASSFLLRPTHDVVTSLQVGYVPDGMSPAAWQKLKQKEAENIAKKKFAALGPQSFKSRSLQSFQTDLEKGKAGHLLPVFNAKEKLQSGKLKQEDIPYMQRLGSWDNSDVSSAKKRQWSDLDKKYVSNPDPNRNPYWNVGMGSRAQPPKNVQPAAAAKKAQGGSPKKLFGLF